MLSEKGSSQNIVYKTILILEVYVCRKSSRKQTHRNTGNTIITTLTAVAWAPPSVVPALGRAWGGEALLAHSPFCTHFLECPEFLC